MVQSIIWGATIALVLSITVVVVNPLWLQGFLCCKRQGYLCAPCKLWRLFEETDASLVKLKRQFIRCGLALIFYFLTNLD